MRFVSIWYNKKYTLLIMAGLKQAYYGSCFVASCMHLQLKKVDPFITKRAHQISVTWAHGWAHTLLFLGNTLLYIYTSWLPGFARDPPPLPPSLPFVPPFCPPSLGLPGFGQNIWSVIAQNNSIPEIHLKKWCFFLGISCHFPTFIFLPPTIPTATPLGWGGQFV